MRPKKIILCVEPNENDLSVLAFMLSTHHYRVLAARNAAEAQDMFLAHDVALVLAAQDLAAGTGDQLLRHLGRLTPHHIPSILLGDAVKMANQVHHADALLSKKNFQPGDLLERIKVMAARKRGPRKGSTRIPPASVPAPAAAGERKLA